jgi:hypothetical protein
MYVDLKKGLFSALKNDEEGERESIKIKTRHVIIKLIVYEKLTPNIKLHHFKGIKKELKLLCT